MLARIAVPKAMNPNVKRVFNPTAKVIIGASAS
jgi:hypothetical protein